jgi:hypothetical protein
MRFLFVLLFFVPQLLFADAVIFSGNDVKALKYNLDLFGRSKVMGLNVDPRSGAGVTAPLGSIGMDYLTGEIYYKSGALATDWISISGSLIGTPNTFAGYDTNGLLYTLPDWDVSTETGGVDFDKTLAQADLGVPTTYYINKFATNLNPTNDLVNLTYTGLRNELTLGTVNDFSYTIGFENVLTVQNTGNKGDINLVNNALNLGDGTNASLTDGVSAINSTLTIENNHTNSNANNLNLSNVSQAGSTTDSITGLNMSTFVEGDINNGINGYYSNIDVQSDQTIGVNGYQNYVTTDSDLNYISGYQFSTTLNSGSVITNSVQGFSDSSDFNSGSSLNGGHYPFTSYANIDSGSAVDGYTGVNIAPNINGSMTGFGYNGFLSSSQFSSTLDYLNSFRTSNTYQSGMTVANGIEAFSDTSQMNNGSATDYYTSFNVSSTFGATATIDDYKAIAVNPTINSTVGNSIQLMTLSPSGSGSSPSVNGIDVNLSALTATTNQKTGLNINDGSLAVTSNMGSDEAWFGLASSANYLGGTYNIVSGSPVSGPFVFGNNLAVNLLAEDDMAADSTTLGLGYSVVGYVGQAAVVSGKTVADYNMATSGFGIPAASTGGTITNATLYHALGALPQGGTLNVTNMYGFRAGPGLSGASPTNTWGISIEDSTAENHFEKSVSIGTSTKKVTNSSVGFEIGGTTKALRLPVLTTTQRDALAALEGMVIFNTTTNYVEYYDGTSWVSVTGGGGGGGNLAVRTETSNYTAVTTDDVILCNGAITVTLPTASGNTGKVFYIKNINSSSLTCTLATTSSQTIDGELNQYLFDRYAAITVVSDGSNWIVL